MKLRGHFNYATFPKDFILFKSFKWLREIVKGYKSAYPQKP